MSTEGSPTKTAAFSFKALMYCMDQAQAVWDRVPRGVIALYVLTLCFLFQTVYWDQMGINFLEFMTISQAASRCVFPFCALFLSLILLVSLSDDDDGKWQLDMNNKLHRWVDIIFKGLLIVSVCVLIFFDIFGPDFHFKSFLATTLLMVVVAMALFIVSLTNRGRDLIRKSPHRGVVCVFTLSFLGSTMIARLLGGLSGLGNESTEVIFSDSNLALRLSNYRYVDSIGSKHVFVMSFPERKVALVETSQVKAIIYRDKQAGLFKPLSTSDRNRGAEDYFIALKAMTGPVVERDIGQGMRYLLKAANAGNASAQYLLSVCYKDGEGVSVDRAESMLWLQKAAEGDDVDAQAAMAVAYQKGDGVEKSEQKAFGWVLRSAMGGKKVAQELVLTLYEGGVGTDRNNVNAEAWRIVIGGAELTDAKSKGFSPDEQIRLNNEVRLIRETISTRARHAGR